MKYKIGDKVITDLKYKVITNKYNYKGTITDTHLKCPMDSDWLAIQDIQPIRKSKRVHWYTINTDPDGQVVVPEYMIDFQMCTIDYYGNRTYI